MGNTLEGSAPSRPLALTLKPRGHIVGMPSVGVPHSQVLCTGGGGGPVIVLPVFPHPAAVQ